PGRLWLFQPREQLSDLAQLVDRLRTQAECHAAWRAEEIRQHRHCECAGCGARLLEKQRGALCTQNAFRYLGHFQRWRNRNRDSLQLAERIELLNEVT